MTVASDELKGLADDTVAVILAGGRGARLGALTRRECKPALPFGGSFRNIDFSLSNSVNSGVRRIGVLTQYQDASLLRHIAETWHSPLRSAGVECEPWRSSAAGGGGSYCGTADAVHQNWHRIEAFDRRFVLVLAGDHVYQMDYRPMLRQHVIEGADATVGCIDVPISEASQFGVMSVDGRNRILQFTKKPEHPESAPGRPGRALGSMGIYIFNRETLAELLRADARAPGSTHDFGRDLIPALVERARLMAYPFTAEAQVGAGYWRDVGTIAAYWRAHMELLDGIPGVDFSDRCWPVLPFDRIAPRPVRAGAKSGESPAGNYIAARGCRIGGATLRRSVLFADVEVAERTELTNAVVLPGAVIGRDCRLTNVIVDAGVRIPDGIVVESRPHRFGIAEPVLLTAETDFSLLGFEHPSRLDRAALCAGSVRRTGS